VNTVVEPEPDKRPFMNLNEAPECPACGVPMVLHTEKHFLRPATKLYICPNAPACNQTHVYEE
jgi:ssDNA-binding Zn-finger/Zn-ribbon topoisomerase 1